MPKRFIKIGLAFLSKEQTVVYYSKYHEFTNGGTSRGIASQLYSSKCGRLYTMDEAER